MPRIRSTLAGATAAALVLTAAAPAAADTLDAYTGQAGTAGLTLDVLGQSLLEVAASDAEVLLVGDDGEAAAQVVPLALGGQAPLDRFARSEGATVVDPDEDACEAALPGELSPLVSGGLLCGVATATGDDPSASAVGGVAELGVLSVDGEGLGGITDLLGSLPLDDLLGQLESQVLGQLRTGVLDDVRDQCVSALQTLISSEGTGLLDPLLGALDPLLGTLTDLVDDLATATGSAEIDALLGEITDLLDDPAPTVCGVLDTVTDLLTGDLLGTITSGDLSDALGDADGVVTVSLLDTASELDRDGDTVTATSGPADGGAIRIAVTIPILGDVLAGLLEDAVAPLLTQLQDALAPVGDVTSSLPVVGDLVGPLLDSGTTGQVLDGSLLSVGLVPGSASVTGDLDDGTTSGEASPAVVELGGTLFALPVLSGLDDALDGVSRALDDALLSQLRDTPLVDLVDVTLLPEEVEETTLDGFPGTRATSGTASVRVLAIAGDPLLDLQVAPATAALGIGEVEPEEPGDEPTPEAEDPQPVGPAGPEPEPLPVTGGGLLFGLLALGAAGLLRRGTVS